MRIQRFVAKDMRGALAQVRDALGPDAVILSSGRQGSDVEVVAAMDFEANAADVAVPAQASVASAGVARELLGAAEEGRPRGHDAGGTAAARSARRASSQISSDVRLPEPPPAKSVEGGLVDEMKDMRRMLEAQLATLAWHDMTRRAPVQAAMLKELAQLGLTQDLANSLVRKVPNDLSFSAARRFALATIARTLQVTGDRWLEEGGCVAFAGPAGAGKTTLIAKLAARWVLRHGPRRIAIVSADSVRLGAHDQMHMLGRLLGVTAHNIYDVEELPELLQELRGCRFVLIDTAGASPRDPALARRLRLLQQMNGSLETALVLPASTQAGALDEVVQRFALARPASCAITKVDEAVTLGGVISALIRHKLVASYVSDGQRVPEDLAPARPHVLVSRAVEIASHNGASADDEVMQRRMSGVAHARR